MNRSTAIFEIAVVYENKIMNFPHFCNMHLYAIQYNPYIDNLFYCTARYDIIIIENQCLIICQHDITTNMSKYSLETRNKKVNAGH